MDINLSYKNNVLFKQNNPNITFGRLITKASIIKVTDKAKDSFIKFEEKQGPITFGKIIDTNVQILPLVSFLYLPEQGLSNTLANAAIIKLLADAAVVVTVKAENIMSNGLKRIHKSLYTEEMAADTLTTKNLPFNTYVRVWSFIKKKMNKNA